MWRGYLLEKIIKASVNTSSFEERLDEEVVIEAQISNVRAQEYLINKYKNFVKAKAKF